MRNHAEPAPPDPARTAAPLLAAGGLLALGNLMVPAYVRPGLLPLAVFLGAAVSALAAAVLVARFGIPARYVLPAALAADVNAVSVLWSLQHPLAAGPVVLTLSLPTMLVALFGTTRALAVQVIAATGSAGVILGLSGDQWPEMAAHLALAAYTSAGSGYIVLGLRRHLERTILGAHEQSVTDHLTALHNRRGFEHRALELATSAVRNGRPVTVLLGDVDRFKRVNDTFGHAVGDDVLRAVAEAVRGCVRETDVVARLGGEEFVVLSTARPAEVPVLAERIRLAVAEACTAWGVTISIGASWSRPPDGATAAAMLETVWSLVDEADRQMFEAKRDGRNRVRMPSS